MEPTQFLEAQFEPDLVAQIKANSSPKTFKANDVIMDIGLPVQFMPIILKGAIKILQEDDEGEELLLYFLEKGETCAMTLQCCLGNAKSQIRAIAEVDTDVLMVPVKFMDEWAAKYSSWRKFVFESYHERFVEMMQAIDSIAFQNLDDRLSNYLLEKRKLHENDIVQITHQEIAYDLHSSRVVVSRLLKKLENRGDIKLHRNSIDLSNL